MNLVWREREGMAISSRKVTVKYSPELVEFSFQVLTTKNFKSIGYYETTYKLGATSLTVVNHLGTSLRQSWVETTNVIRRMWESVDDEIDHGARCGRKKKKFKPTFKLIERRITTSFKTKSYWMVVKTIDVMI